MREIKNIPVSVHTRLLNLAKSQNKPFQEILQYYCIERFLFRLSQTEYGLMFVLKGGLVFYALGFALRRTTRDIDLRGFTKNSTDNLIKIFRTIGSVQVPYDGLVFQTDTIRFEEILIDADYHGVRISFEVRLGTSKIHLHIDVGFSDVITPAAQTMKYPSLLDDMESTVLKGYPPESIISEKFQAMVRLVEINSRWKDFYDIWMLSETFDFDGKILQKAIAATFEQRETAIPVDIPVALTDAFALARQRQWETFLVKNKVLQENNRDFVSVITQLRSFLFPPVQAISENRVFEQHWVAENDWQ
jgi:predicted nucleotidyltransferase component of viral defense system